MENLSTNLAKSCVIYFAYTFNLVRVPKKFTWLNKKKLQITGDANEDQIILSLQVYLERRALLQNVLNETYQLYRFGAGHTQYTTALHAILKVAAVKYTFC